MKQKLLAQDASERTFILVLEEGDEAFSAISAFAAQADIAGDSVTAIGAFSSATVGFFRIESRDYRKIPVAEQSEARSAILPGTKPAARACICMRFWDWKTGRHAAGTFSRVTSVRPWRSSSAKARLDCAGASDRNSG